MHTREASTAAFRRCRLLLVATLLAAASVAAQGQAPPPGAPSTAALVEDACRQLRDHAAVRAQFPSAVQRLCTPGHPAEATCHARTPQACSLDALCAVRMTFICDRPPCPPGGPARAACAPQPDRALAADITTYRPCVDTGGTWASLPGITEIAPWRGACSCMGATTDGIVNTRDGRPANLGPSTYFVQGRGCVAEATLCEEHRGRWLQSPKDDPRRPRCEIDGKAVAWYLRERLGYEAN